MRPFEPSYILTAFLKIFPYLRYTLEMVGLSFGLALILGFLLAAQKASHHKILRALAYGYTSVMRCTPSVVLLFLVYYGAPMLVKAVLGVDISGAAKIVFATITYTMMHSYVISDIMLAAYEAVDRGQTEAALTVGMNRIQAFVRIVLPQCVAFAIPNLGNSLTALLKDGALAYTIGFIDMMGKTTLLIASNINANALESYIAVSLIYWGLCILIRKLFGWLELRSLRGRNNLKAL